MRIVADYIFRVYMLQCNKQLFSKQDIDNVNSKCIKLESKRLLLLKSMRNKVINN